MSGSQFFSQAAQWTSRQCGRPLTFGLASGVVLVWALTGPLFNYTSPEISGHECRFDLGHIIGATL